jgi:hypothetical protein
LPSARSISERREAGLSMKRDDVVRSLNETGERGE